MKNVVAMARAGTLPRGSKLNLFFGEDRFGAMAPPIPEALELYLAMMEGLDLKWAVGLFGSDKSIMDTPLAQMAQHARWARFADGADEVHQWRIAQRAIEAWTKTGSVSRSNALRA